MDKLDAMQTFVAIAEAGSLTAAARRQGRSLPAVVRLLAALEAELGVRLFQRTTRRIAITEAGRRYLERCRAAQSIIDEGEAELRAEQTEPQGKLRVTAPVLFGQLHVSSGITAYVQRYPKVTAELQLLDRVVSLVEEGIDVGVRIGPMEDSSLIGQQVSTMRRLTVAAPSYLSRHGAPKHPKDLVHHNCISFTSPAAVAWSYVAQGKPVSIAVRGNYSVNHAVAAADACAAGLGIGMFRAYQVARQVASGELTVILASFEPPLSPVHLVYPEVRLVPARTRVFIDFIKEHIRARQAAWQRIGSARRK